MCRWDGEVNRVHKSIEDSVNKNWDSQKIITEIAA